MNPKTRVRLLLIIFIGLIAANVYFRLGDSTFDGAGFWADGVELNNNISPSLTRKIEEIRQSPQLSFRKQQENKETPRIGRNPFIFGVDRRAEASQQQRLADLQAKREEMLAQAAEQPQTETVVEEKDAPLDAEIVGIFENLENGVRKAAIRTDQGLQTVGKGDLLNRRYRVLHVAYTYVKFYDLTEKRELKLDVTP